MSPSASYSPSASVSPSPAYSPELITNPSFATDTAGWTLTNYARVAEDSPADPYSIAATAYADDPEALAISNHCACEAGRRLGVSFWHRYSLAGLNSVGYIDYKVKFYNVSNVLLQTRTLLSLEPHAEADSGWLYVDELLTAAPANTAYVTFTARVQPDAAPSGALLVAFLDVVSVKLAAFGDSPSASPSVSPSLSPSASRSPSASYSPSASASPTLSASASPSLSPSASVSPSPSASLSPSASYSPSASVSPSPSQPIPQEAYGIGLWIAGVNYWGYLLNEGLTVTQAERGEIGTLSCVLENYDGTLPDFTTLLWSDVYCITDTGYALFGGYLINAQPAYSKSQQYATWTLKCESWATLLKRLPTQRKTYLNQTAGAIIADLFTSVGLTDFDLTYVYAGDVITTFTTSGEKFNEILDRLASIANTTVGIPFIWWIRPEKYVLFGVPALYPAPFGIAQLAAADWMYTFPVLKDSLTRQEDSTNIRNRVTVRGGTTPSVEITDTFTGDGVTTIFQLTNRNVWKVSAVTLDGVTQSYGTDWYDDFGGSYNTLINYPAGTVRWPDAQPPNAGQAIVVKYQYGTPVTVTRTIEDVLGPGANTFGIWFDDEVEERSITSLAAATLIADAILWEYALPLTNGQFTIEKLGLEPGQAITITDTILGLTGSYVIRRVTTSITKKGAAATVQFGGRPPKYSSYASLIPGNSRSGAYGYDQPTLEQLLASNQLRVVATATDYAVTYADFLIAITDAQTAPPRTITLPVAAEAYNRYVYIKDASGQATATPVSIVVSGGGLIDGASSVSLGLNYGSFSFYSDGTQWHVLTDTSISATSGIITGLLRIGDGDPYIILDGPNARIATSDFATDVAGWQIPATGDVEFNNMLLRGRINSAVFERSQLAAIAGSQIVTKSASTLHTACTVTATTFTLDVWKQAQGAPFDAADIVLLKDATNATWATVNAGSDQTLFWRYTATTQYQTGSSTATFAVGLAVIDYGVSGQGYYIVSADGLLGASAAWALRSHAGKPWLGENEPEGETTHVYAGTDGRLYAGGGRIKLDANSITLSNFTRGIVFTDPTAEVGALQAQRATEQWDGSAITTGVINKVALDSTPVLGAELITNPSFATDTTGWTLTRFYRVAEASPADPYSIITIAYADDPEALAISNHCACYAGSCLRLDFWYRYGVVGMNNVGFSTCAIEFYDEADDLLETRTVLTLSPYLDSDSGWLNHDATLAAAPADTAYAIFTVNVQADAFPSGAILFTYLDAVSVKIANFTEVGIAVQDDGIILNGHTRITGDLRVDGSILAPLRQVLFTVAGELSVGTLALRMPNHLGSTATITGVYLDVNTEPTDAALIVDIHQDGTTIFTDQDHRPQIASAAYSGNTTTIDVPAWASGSYLTLDIDQIGSSVPGSNLTCTVVFAV